MFHHRNSWMYIIIALVVIGLFSGFARNPGGVILPLVVFGIIFYLYKFPPRWLMRWVGRPPASSRRHASKQKSRRPLPVKKSDKKQPLYRKRRKDVPLKVIDGNKKDWPPRRKSQ